MRKNAKQYIELNCSHCNNPFQKEAKEHKRKIKIGQEKFYCSPSCGGIGTGISQRDEFTKFRIFMFSTKHTAKTKNIDFNLDLDFLKNLWKKQNGKCPYTNIPMILADTPISKNRSLKAASLDRIDSSQGYIKDNVEFVCRFVNLGKNTFPQNEVKDFFKEISGDTNVEV